MTRLLPKAAKADGTRAGDPGKRKTEAFKAISFFLAASFCLVSGCSVAGGVGWGEFNELSGRVTNLEDVVVERKLSGTAAPYGAQVMPGQGTAPPAGLPLGTVPDLSGVPVFDPATGAISAPAPRSTGGERTRYANAMSLLRRKRYDEAASAFRSFLADLPGARLAPNARYWLGECHYAKGEFVEALREFQSGFAQYPHSGKGPDYLLKAAYSQSRLGDGPGAMESLRLLLELYPNSDSANLVKSGRSKFPNGI
ncbi:MAG: tol-pal system protein YbgF [Deltaproteobacteria bacterium]|jgi:tol-pal system protein YbgF|nr:tol-pal system protein YbgF [Deltaproteobacteria bacterium]